MGLRNAFGDLALETTLSSIKTWLDSRLGTKSKAASVSITLADGEDVSTGAKQDAGNTSLANIANNIGNFNDEEALGNGSEIGILKRLRTLLGGVLQVRGTRSNAGVDQALGASHLTVGGTDGASLRPFLTDNLGRQVVLIDVSRLEALINQLVMIGISPSGFDRVLNRQRNTAVVESGTVTTVTTVTTVSDLTSMGGRPAQMLINQINLSAWAACHRSRIT